MTLKRIYLAAMLGAAAVAAPAQNTRLLTADKANEYGIVYSLPVTELQIDLQATFTQRVAGPYRQYAPRYLGNVEVVEADSRSCRLDKAEVATRGRAGSQQYLLTLKPGATTAVCVATDGMLLAINAQPDAPAPHVSSLSSSAPTPPDMDEYLQYVDEDYLVSLSEAKKAQMLARTIMEIRESRLSLSRGTAETMPTDGRQLELMLESLRKQEDALMRAFTGYEYSYTESRSITLEPDSTMLQGERIVIARLSPGENFSGSDDLVGEPIYLSFSGLSAPEMPLNVKGEPKLLPKDAVIYRLPSTVTASIDYEGRTLLTEQLQMAQCGELFGLDPKLFTDKKQPSYALFDPATGALQKVAAVPAQ